MGPENVKISQKIVKIMTGERTNLAKKQSIRGSKNKKNGQK